MASKDNTKENKIKVGINKNAVGISISKAESEIIENPTDFFGGNTQDSVVDMISYMKKIDPMLKGFSSTRLNALLALKREITGNGQEADFVRDVFSNIKNFHTKLSGIMQAVNVGYSVTELIWTEQDSKYILDLQPRHQGKFKFNEFGEAYLVTEDSNYKITPEKFAILTYNEEYGNRYGNGEYQSLYWYWYIKKESVKFWSIFTERFAVPVIIAEKPNGMDVESEEEIDNFISDFKSATSISLPKDVVIRFLEAKNTNSIDTFDTFIDFLNKSMAIAYLGQTDTSGVNKNASSYARAKIQDGVREDILLSDIMLIENFINDNIIKLLVDINFPNVKKYPKWRIVINKHVDAETIKKLVEAGHRKIPVNWVNKIFGIPFNKDTTDNEYLEVAKNNTFTESNFAEQKALYLQELEKILK